MTRERESEFISGVAPLSLSAEALLKHQIAEEGEWLAAQGFNPALEEADPEARSRDRLLLRYGIFIGLKQALALLTANGHTVH